MSSDIKELLFVIFLFVGLVTVGITIMDVTENEYKAVSEPTDASEVGQAEVLNYSELSEANQELFRKQLSTKSTTKSLTDIETGTYIQLDGRYYEVTTHTQVKVLKSTIGYILLALSAAILPGVALAISDGLNIKRWQFIALTVCMIFALVSATIIFHQPYTETTVEINSTPVSTVSEDAIVKHAESYSDAEYNKLLDGFAGVNKDTRQYEDFVDEDIDYIKSDGEYYAVEQKEVVPTLQELMDMFILAVEILLPAAGLADSVREKEWAEGGGLIE